MDLLPDLIRYSSIMITATMIWYLTFRRSSIHQFNAESFEPLMPHILWRKILWLYLVTRLLLAGTFMVYAFAADHRWKTDLGAAFTRFFYKYDSPRYLNIAETGYHAVGTGQENIAFYPLYPGLVRLLHYVVPNYALAAVLVSNSFLLLGMYYLVRLAELEWKDSRKAVTAAKYALLFPFTFFFSLIYTESVFMTLTILSFYALRRSKWLMAGCFGLLAAFTRNQGVLLSLPIAIELVAAVRRELRAGLVTMSLRSIAKRYASGIVAVLMPAIGTFLYLLVNKLVTGDWLRFLYYEREFWVQKFGFFADNLAVHVYRILHYHKPLNTVGIWLPQVVLFFAVSLVLIQMRNRFRFSYLAYSFAYIMISYAPTGLLSGPRYVSGMFTLYLFLACIASDLSSNKRKWFDALLLGFLLFYTYLFGIGYVI